MGCRLWLRSVVRRRQVERELDDELSFHFDQQVAENLAAGMTPEEARHAARRLIGGMTQVREECRDARGTGWMIDFARDLRYAVRTLRRAPTFTAAVVVTLALGLGANTAVFSIANAVLLRMLPVRQPERLFQVLRPELSTGRYFDLFSFLNYQSMRDAESSVAELVAERTGVAGPVTVDGAVETARRSEVSGNYFDVLGAGIALGSGMRPEFDREPGRHPVAVISYSFWQRRFHADPGALGHSIAIGGTTFRIIGVAEPGFSGIQVGAMADLWTLASMGPARRLRIPFLTEFRVLGRLKPGASMAAALAPLQVQFHREIEDGRKNWPSSTPPALIARVLGQKLKLVPAARGISPLRQQYGEPLEIVVIVVALVLLVACGNVANLLLARAGTRRREMAMRLSLGAGRARLVRQLLAESLLLAFAAAGFGLLLAEWSVPALVRLLGPSDAPVQLAAGLDARVLAFAAAAALGTAVLFGLFPALRASRVDIHESLKSGGRASRGAGGSPGKLLVMSQIALSVLLVTVSALFLRTLHNLHHVDMGFNRWNLVVAGVQLRNSPGGRLADLAWERVRQRVEQIPGVASASLSAGTPFSSGYGNGTLRLPDAQAKIVPCWFYAVSLDYFRTIASPLVAGRDFEPRDFEPDAPAVAIIGEAVARVYFGKENPVGRRIGNFEQEDGEWAEVVGVARDTSFQNLRAPAPPIVYLPFTMSHSGVASMIMEVRVRRDTASMAPALRRAAAAAGSGFAVNSVTTETRLIDDSLSRERLLATLGSFFGALALVLAAIGIYGTMSYAVTQRTPEIGIRMAVGAVRADVLRMVLRDALVLVGVGSAIGIAAAYFAGRAVASLLFGLQPGDPASLCAAVAVLGAATVGAAALPAWRAACTDPMTALREE